MILLPMVTGTELVFWICAVLAILGAIGLVSFTKPVYSALCLALVMISLAVIYASLGAPFLFATQIIVYTGAVLMLFLFVVMLVGVGAEDSLAETMRGHRLATGLAALGVLVLLVLAVMQSVLGDPVGTDGVNMSSGGNVEGLAQLIFSRYVFAFEVTAVLLITAAVAAMVLTHPEQLRKKPGQSEMAAARLEAYADAGFHPGPLPSSGVFAMHNSMSTPALLPDGSIAPDSIPEIMSGADFIPTPDELLSAHEAILADLEPGEDRLDYLSVVGESEVVDSDEDADEDDADEDSDEDADELDEDDADDADESDEDDAEDESDDDAYELYDAGDGADESDDDDADDSDADDAGDADETADDAPDAPDETDADEGDTTGAPDEDETADGVPDDDDAGKASDAEKRGEDDD